MLFRKQLQSDGETSLSHFQNEREKLVKVHQNTVCTCGTSFHTVFVSNVLLRPVTPRFKL